MINIGGYEKNGYNASLGASRKERPGNHGKPEKKGDVKEKNTDRAEFSSYMADEAKAAAEAYYLNQVAEETPDVRQDLVAAIKEKIKDPNYLNQAVIASTADRILASYGL